jgi:ubiquinone/menaquinone biosynthesis C-methylase UbiE
MGISCELANKQRQNMKTEVEDVQAFWNANPCQSRLSRAQDRFQYFQEISERRYGRREWHVPTIAKFDAFRGKDVLEIGCSIATDGLEFAKNGANYVGVDLTPASLELARERFDLFGVRGRFETANAEERLPFADDSFDHIYSFGVIHHSPAPEKIVRELHRVLKKGGTFTVMLYNRSSINYYVEIMFLRKLFRWLLLPGFMPQVLSAITGFDRWKLEGHQKILRERKNLSKQDWISMNTDGPYCPLARVYSHREAADLFRDFQDVRQEVWEFNVEHWSFIGRAIPNGLAKWIGRHWGWHRIIYGQKA